MACSLRSESGSDTEGTVYTIISKGSTVSLKPFFIQVTSQYVLRIFL